MNKYQLAAETFRNQAAKWKAISEAAEVLEEVGGLEQIAREFGSRAEHLKRECEKIEIEVDAAKTALAAAVAKAAETIREADDRATSVIADAEARSASIMSAARAEAEAEAEVAGRRRDAVVLEAEGAVAKVAATRAELATVQENIERARLQVKSILGAGA